MRGRALGLVGHQQFHDHRLGRLGAVAGGVDLHANGWLAHAGGGEHALALDLDHAGPAIAVGAVIRSRRIAEMRDFGAAALRHLPDRLAERRLDPHAVEFEADAFSRNGCTHDWAPPAAKASGK